MRGRKFCYCCKIWIDSQDSSEHLASAEHKKNSTNGLLSPNFMFDE